MNKEKSMFVIAYLVSFLAGFFRPGITTVKTSPDPISGVEQAGALVPNGGMIGALGALQQNAAPAFGNWSQTLVPASLAANTMNANQVVGGIIRRFATTSAYTDCTDTATNIVNAIPGAKINQTFPLIISNLGSGAPTMTLAGGAGVTIAGTATINGNSFRLFLGQVTGSAAVTITNCFQWTSNPVGAVTTGL